MAEGILTTPYANRADEPTSCTTSCTHPSMLLHTKLAILYDRGINILQRMQWRVGCLLPMCCCGAGTLDQGVR
jgi:hypothetical protein